MNLFLDKLDDEMNGGGGAGDDSGAARDGFEDAEPEVEEEEEEADDGDASSSSASSSSAPRRRERKCKVCRTPMPIPEGAQRIRDGTCKQCERQRRSNRYHNKPFERVLSCWRTEVKSRKIPKGLHNRDLVMDLWKKYDHRCAITKETDASKLRFISLEVDSPLSTKPEDIVLVCRNEARNIKALTTTKERRDYFPPDAQLIIRRPLR